MRLDNEQNERNLQVTLNAYAYRIKCGTLDGGHFAFFKGVVYQDAFAMNGSTPSYSARARYKVSNGVLTFVDGGYYEFHFASSTLYRKVTTTVYDGVCEVLSANSGNL